MNSLLKCLFFFSGCLISLSLVSQNQCSQWYFGIGAGLDFTTNPPVNLANGALQSDEGSSSAADAAGNLLFYSNGVTVWNKLHQTMANGTGLHGHYSTAQSCLIVKQPGNASIYYVFTLDLQGMANGLKYSVVDMSLAAGMGSVTIKNVALYAPGMEQLSGTLHCNGTDIWVISHQINTNNFVAYLLSSGGVGIPAVVSSVGSVYGANGIGIIKLSTNGKKLAATYTHGNPSLVQIFDFDASTGIVSNPVTVLSGTPKAYGCEFSPDGSKLYASTAGSGFSSVYQWDICAGSTAAIQNSQVELASLTGVREFQALQLAQNGKIYCCRTYISGSPTPLDVIDSPNSAGQACNYLAGGQVITTGETKFGLPNFICSNFKSALVFTHTVDATSYVCNTANFAAPSSLASNQGCTSSNSSGISFIWNFGDPASGAANTSTLFSTFHTYPGVGSYTVKLIVNGNCSSDTLTKVVNITSSCVGIKVIPGSNKIAKIYPNPFNSSVTLESTSSADLTLHDANGEIVRKISLHKGLNDIDLSFLNSGMYCAQIVSEENRETIRLVKN